MTDDDLKNLVASLAIAQAETTQQIRELGASLAVSQAKTDEQIRELKESQAKTDEQIRELKESQAKTDEQITELKESQAKTDEQITELGQHIGGLHNKFGSYVEALAFPSIKRVMIDKFGADSFDYRCQRRNKQAGIMEVDAIASSNSGANQVFMIEIKSLLKQDGLEQTLKNLQRFKQFFPEHKDRELFGVLAYTDIEKEGLKQQVLKHGIYLAHVSDNLFELQVSDTFRARAF